MTSINRENTAESPSQLTPFTISLEEAERLSAIGRSNLYQLMQRGRVKSRKIGRRRLVIVDSLRSFLLESEEQ